MKLIFGLMLLASAGWAQFDQTIAVSKGSELIPNSITGSSITGTALPISNKMVDLDIFNNTSFIIWVGTSSATTQLNHANIESGRPILSSASYRLDGSVGTPLYFTCDHTKAACNVRIFEFKRVR